jgi:hypothetical protein
MKKLTDQDSALKHFREAATRHAEATEEGDFRTANKAYRELTVVRTFLQEQEAMESLALLLRDEPEGVTIWAATFLLPIMEKDAVATLEAIAAQPGSRRFDAEMTLREWKAGRLR